MENNFIYGWQTYKWQIKVLWKEAVLMNIQAGVSHVWNALDAPTVVSPAEVRGLARDLLEGFFSLESFFFIPFICSTKTLLFFNRIFMVLVSYFFILLYLEISEEENAFTLLSLSLQGRLEEVISGGVFCPRHQSLLLSISVFFCSSTLFTTPPPLPLPPPIPFSPHYLCQLFIKEEQVELGLQLLASQFFRFFYDHFPMVHHG